MAAPTNRAVATRSTHQNYIIGFFGNQLSVTVTPSPSVIKEWINDVVNNNRRRSPYSTHPLVVGVGVQWSPFRYSDDYSDNPADTLQLCVGKRILIIQLSHCRRVPNELGTFLTDPDTTYVGVWNSQDVRKLGRCRHELQIGRLLDLRHYVTDSEGRGLRRCPFGMIVAECMGYQGVRLDPEISLSDWSVYSLRTEQILQASIDAYVCSELGVRFRLWEV